MRDDDAVQERLDRFSASPYVLTLPYGHPAQHKIYIWLEKNVGKPTWDWILGASSKSLRYAFLSEEHFRQATAFAESCEE